MEKKKKVEQKAESDKITRKEAIKKVGVSALAATSLVFLETKANASGSCVGGRKSYQQSGTKSGRSFGQSGPGKHPKPDKKKGHKPPKPGKKKEHKPPKSDKNKPKKKH